MDKVKERRDFKNKSEGKVEISKKAKVGISKEKW